MIDPLKKYILRFEGFSPIVLIAILAATGLLLYARSLFNGFIGDDYANIIQNTLVHQVSNIPQMFTSDPLFNRWPFYRPLMYVVFSFIYSLFGPQAGFYHLFDILLHVVNVVLVFVFLKKVFVIQKFRFSQALAFILSLIFLIHPVNVETVAYIAVTQDLMFGFFLLLALLATDYYCRRKGSLKVIFLIHFLVLACLLSKESGIIVVALIPTFCYLIYKQLNKTIISFAITPLAIYLLMRFMWDSVALTLKYTVVAVHNVSLQTRLITFPYEVASYIKLMFFPKDLYNFHQEIVHRVSDQRFYLSLILVLVAVTVVLWLYFRYKSKILTFFALWIIVGLLIYSNIVPLSQTVAERWMYVPLIGALGFFGSIFARLKNKKAILIIVFLTLVFIPLAVVRTYVRIGDWKDAYTLLTRDIQYAENDPNANDAYAMELLQKGNAKASITYLERALSVKSEGALFDVVQVKIHLGMALGKDGKMTKARSVFSEMLQDKKNLASFDYILTAYFNTVDANPNPDDVIKLIQKAIKLSPNDIFLNQTMAKAYFRKQDWNSTLSYVRRVYELEPSTENLQSLNVVEAKVLGK